MCDISVYVILWFMWCVRCETTVCGELFQLKSSFRKSEHMLKSRRKGPHTELRKTLWGTFLSRKSCFTMIDVFENLCGEL